LLDQLSYASVFLNKKVSDTKNPLKRVASSFFALRESGAGTKSRFLPFIAEYKRKGPTAALRMSKSVA